MLSLSVLLVAVPTHLAYEPLLRELTTFYSPDAFIDDVTSIALDPINRHLYATNTASGTIDILSYADTQDDSSDSSDHAHTALSVLSTIDIKLEASTYFNLDYITHITALPNHNLMVASLIPFHYASNTGWLVLIDTNTLYIHLFQSRLHHTHN